MRTFRTYLRKNCRTAVNKIIKFMQASISLLVRLKGYYRIKRDICTKYDRQKIN